MIQKAKNNQGFTILELMISMTLFALIITSVIIAVENLSIARIKTLNRVALLEELYFFSEQLFTGIKDWGTLDYEEYWNRKAVGNTTASWHYLLPTGVGNYGKNGILGTTTYGTGIYLCRSNSGATMGTGWCLQNSNNGGSNYLSGTQADFSGAFQRYGEYLVQFTDYNGNTNIDFWDQDADASGSIVGDDDDRIVADITPVLTGSMQELYLINKSTRTRAYFRWNIEQDPNTSIACTISTSASGKTITGSGCVGNVQVLKLKGLDLGLGHSWSIVDATLYDGIVDTWVCVEDGQCSGPTVLSTRNIATGSWSEWLNMFPSSINVKNLSFQIYPVKDPWLSWAAPDCLISNPTCISPFIHPYIRMNLEMWFAWGKRRTLLNEDPTISIATSISLSDFE
jgi:prepilin-type N-terminal cleavage/methylation domain-containing protein